MRIPPRTLDLYVAAHQRAYACEKKVMLYRSAEVRRRLTETQDTGVAQVQGVTLRSIERIPDQTVGDI